MAFTEKQAALRKQGIGASEVAAVLGLDRHVTPFDVWARKRGLLAEKEHDSDPIGNLPAYMGTVLEPVVAELYQMRHREEDVRLSDTYQHPEHAWAVATPDRELFVGGERVKLLEIKTKDWRSVRDFGMAGTDELPGNVMCQVQWQLCVLAVPLAVVAVLVDGREYREYQVPADPELQAMMLDRVGHFWHQHVETGVEPPLVGSEARKYLAGRFPTHGQEMMRATEADERLLLELSAVRHAERETAQAREAIENTLKARIGEHRGMQGLTTRATWALTKDSERVDWKAVAADLYGRLAFHGMANAEQFAALTAAHTTVSPGVRRFLFTEKSE